jgi:hypothetical protein
MPDHEAAELKCEQAFPMISQRIGAKNEREREKK